MPATGATAATRSSMAPTHQEVAPPPDRPIDGKDLSPLLFNLPGAKPPHEALFFSYEKDELQAMRAGRWKLLFPHTSRTIHGQPPGKDGTPTKYLALAVGLELYDLEADVGESHNLATDRPDVVKHLQSLADPIRAQLGFLPIHHHFGHPTVIRGAPYDDDPRLRGPNGFGDALLVQRNAWRGGIADQRGWGP